MTKTTLSTLIAVLLFGGVLAQPKPDDPSCIQGNQRRAHDCCRMPTLVDQSIMNRCMAENPMTLPVPGVQRTEGCCTAQCIFTTLNAFKDNTIDKEAVKRAITQSVGSDANFSPLISGVVDECFNLVNNNATFTVTPVPATPGRAGCSFVPEGFVNCVKTKLFQQCPAAAWTQDADCDNLKQKLSSGCTFHSLMG